MGRPLTEAMAANLLVSAVMFLDAKMKLGIVARHAPTAFALTGLFWGAYGHMSAFVPLERVNELNTTMFSFSKHTIIVFTCLTVTAVALLPRRHLFLMCATNFVCFELPHLLYLAFGVTTYNDRWFHPSRQGWVRGAAQELASAPVGPGRLAQNEPTRPSERTHTSTCKTQTTNDCQMGAH